MINLVPVEKIFHLMGGGKKYYYLEVKQAEPLEFEAMCRLIGDRSGASPFTVEMIVNEVADVIVENAKIGRGVNLGNLGVVQPIINSKLVEKEEDLDLSLIRKFTIHFKPSLRIKKAMKSMRMRVKRDYYAKYKAEKESLQMEDKSVEEQEN